MLQMTLCKRSHYHLSHFLWHMIAQAPVPINYWWELYIALLPTRHGCKKNVPTLCRLCSLCPVSRIYSLLLMLGWVVIAVPRVHSGDSSCSDHALHWPFKLGVDRYQVSLGNMVHFPLQALPFTFSETIPEHTPPEERPWISVPSL